jgi:DNA-binding NarL/FixJ family response regulator
MAQLMLPEPGPIRVLAADSNPMNSQLLVEALGRDKHFIAVAAAEEVLMAVQRENPDIVLLSAQQPEGGRSGFQLTHDIRSLSPTTQVIVLLDRSDRSAVVQAFRAGAHGVFSRTEPLKALLKCIQSVRHGQVWANSRELHFVLEALQEPAPMKFLSVSGNPLLSEREVDVVRCVAEGMTNREIAKQLGLTEHTVKNYLFRIFDKLGVSSRVEVVLYALGNPSSGALPAKATPAREGTGLAES